MRMNTMFLETGRRRNIRSAERRGDAVYCNAQAARMAPINTFHGGRCRPSARPI
jgi:hypothetical protein